MARPALCLGSVGGGELFDRITDEQCHLTELDVVLFTKQICAGVHYLHQHYILHLDLKVGHDRRSFLCCPFQDFQWPLQVGRTPACAPRSFRSSFLSDS